MQSLTELNNFANTSVSYNRQADYAITYGEPLGDTTVNAFEGSTFVVPQQIPIEAMTDITRDLLITLTFDPMAAAAFTQYVGADASIAVVTDGVDRRIVTGVRTVAQYDDVFANLQVGITPGYVDEFIIEVALDDQMGDDFQTYTITVTSEESLVFEAPVSITFTEDENESVANISVVENFLYSTNYTAVIETEDPATSRLALAPANVAANTLTFTNMTKANINLGLANVVFVPGADFVGNTFFTTSVTRLYDSEITGKVTLANCLVDIPEYSAPTTYAWSDNSITTIGTTSTANLAILDLAVGKQYSSTITLSPGNIGNLATGNSNLGNTVTFTGNKITVNNSLSNVTFSGNATLDLSGNVGYVQIQTTDSVTQANIAIPLIYQIPAIHIFSNVAKSFGTRLAANGYYIGGNATANVDFWAYRYNSSNTVSGGVTAINYTTPSTSNVALADIRSTATYKYPPLSLYVRRPYGIRSREEARTAGQAGYFSCWIKFNNEPTGNRVLGVVLGAGGGALYFVAYNYSLYWSVENTRVYNPLAPSGTSRLETRIQLGTIPAVGEYTHFALQISAGSTGSGGTQLVSCWRDGVPVNSFWIGYSVDLQQTGSTWHGKNYFSTINGFQFGAPYPLNDGGTYGYNTAGVHPDMYMDDIQIRNNAPYTDLVAFTPEPVTWGGNVTQMVTGI